jgi:predicted metal-binding membrane protein
MNETGDPARSRGQAAAEPPNTAAAARPGTATTSLTVAAALGLAAVAWVVSAWQMQGMDMPAATGLGSFAFFVPLWAWMMAAMMLPGTVPAVLRRAAAVGARAVPVSAVSYLAIWALVGIAVYAAYRPHGYVAADAVTIAAGLYELTPLKRHFRRRCRDGTSPGWELPGMPGVSRSSAPSGRPTGAKGPG